METVLVIGSTGSIGVSAVTAALRSKRNVLANVRNKASADKLIRYVGSPKGITFAEADALSEFGVKGVVDQVKAGKLPAFQHVYACLGGEYTTTPRLDSTTEQIRRNFNIAFEGNFCKFILPKPARQKVPTNETPTAVAYQATIPSLLSQNDPSSTWTICTGSQGDLAMCPVPAMPQGALFSMSTAAARENESTNVRFNEIYLCFRVEVDELAVEHGVTTASDFGKVFELILDSPEVRSSRVRVEDVGDLGVLKWKRRF